MTCGTARGAARPAARNGRPAARDGRPRDNGPVTGTDTPDLATLRPRLPSPCQEVVDERFERHGVRLLLKRDDLIHPDLVGNKWRKLAPNLATARGRTVVTFGGAYSNHLRATAAAGRLLGLSTVGVVRGQELAERPLNPSLARCAADGMRLHYVDRAAYRRKDEPEALASVLRAVGAEDALVVPEGGSNGPAVRGCRALGEELGGRADVAAVACGTGGTMAGLAAGLPPGARALGVPVLRGGFLAGDIRRLQDPRSASRAATGASTTASTAAATRARLLSWTPSPTTSSTATASPWSASTSPSCCTPW